MQGARPNQALQQTGAARRLFVLHRRSAAPAAELGRSAGRSLAPGDRCRTPGRGGTAATRVVAHGAEVEPGRPACPPHGAGRDGAESQRDGMPLGDTQFLNMHAAYEDLPAGVKQRLEGRTATHDFVKFWDMLRMRPGSNRGPLTPEQRAKKPPVSQPIFRTHPITGKRVLYCNSGYAMWIDGMDRAESDELLAFLFHHQEQPKYRYSHAWTEGDVLMWDNIGTMHNAIADYGDSPRYMRRVQVMATGDYAGLAA